MLQNKPNKSTVLSPKSEDHGLRPWMNGDSGRRPTGDVLIGTTGFTRGATVFRWLRNLHNPYFQLKLKAWLLEGQCFRWVGGNILKIIVGLINCFSPLCGYRVHCSICGWKGMKFYPAVSLWNYRSSAVCPKCGSLERHRALYNLLEKRQMIQKGYICLEIGPSVWLCNYIRKHKAHYISVDLGQLPADIYMDINTLAFRDCSFDFIFCFHVLEYISSWRQAIAELFRVLRLNGTLILSENYTFGQITTVEFDARTLISGTPTRRFGEDLVDTLIKKGFTLERYDYLSYNDARGDWFLLCKKQS